MPRAVVPTGGDGGVGSWGAEAGGGMFSSPNLGALGSGGGGGA